MCGGGGLEGADGREGGGGGGGGGGWERGGGLEVWGVRLMGERGEMFMVNSFVQRAQTLNECLLSCKRYVPALSLPL